MIRSTVSIKPEDYRFLTHGDERAEEARLPGVIRENVEIYRAMVEDQIARVKHTLTQRERMLCYDALQGYWMRDPLSMRPEAVTAEIFDAMSHDGVAEKWGVDQEDLRRKLLAVDNPVTFFIGLCIEALRFFNNYYRQEG